MINQNEQSIQSALQRISNILLINGGFVDNPGLYFGEMGLVLFFFRYARYTGNELYKEYGFRLIEKIQNRIHEETTIDYKHGLAGIGSAIEYLVQNEFIKADTDDVLENFDKRIFHTYNLEFLPVETIESIGYFAYWRTSGKSTKKDSILHTILIPIERIMHDHSITPAWHRPLCNSNSLYLKKETYHHWLGYFSRKSNLSVSPFEGIDKLGEHTSLPPRLGIHNGLTGLGLALLTELDGDISWTALFPNDQTHF